MLSVWVCIVTWLLCLPWRVSLFRVQYKAYVHVHTPWISLRYAAMNDAGGFGRVGNKKIKDKVSSDNIINSINSLAQSVTSNNKDMQDIISHTLSLCVVKCKNGDKDNGWKYATTIFRSCEEHGITLNMNAKSLFIKSAVISNSIADLASLVTNSSLYNTLPLVDSFTLENNMRIFWNGKYIYELLYIMTPYITRNLMDYNNYILSEQCYGYLIKALPYYLHSSNQTGDIFSNNTRFELYNNKTIIRTILEMSLASHNNTITPSLIITALSSCRELDDWQSALEVYNFAKINAKKKHLVNTPIIQDSTSSTLSVLPSIIYGQTIVTLAKGGVEAELFQVVCEMLEDGIIPSTLTVNLLMLELSKRGAYKTMIIIVEQLHRYSISISNMAINSILNACDKVSAYDRVLSYYQERKLSLDQLDAIGVSILIKACDRLSQPAIAMSIIETMYHSDRRDLLTQSMFERVFALFVKEGKGMLATKLLLTLEVKTKEVIALLDAESFDDKEAISYLEFKELFNDLMTRPTPSCNISYYTATISALSREGYAIESSLLLNTYMRYVRENQVFVDKNIENNIITMYTSAISSFRHLQDPDTAEKLFNQIYYESSLHSTIELRSDIFSSLLIVYALSNVPKERFELLLYKMEKDGLKWSSHTYTAVICYLMAREEYNRVITLWDEMIVNNIAPTTTCITEVLKACVLTKQGTKALEVVNYAYHLVTNIRDGGANAGNVKLNLPDLAMYNKVLIALNQANKVDESLVVLELMRDRGIVATASCYVIVLSTMEKNAEWKKAVSLLLQLQTNGLKVDSKLVNLAIAACYRASEWGMIIKLYELMPTLTRNKFIPNQYTYMQAIGAACKLQNSSIALSIYDKMMVTINNQLYTGTNGSSSGELLLPSIAMSSLLLSLLESNQKYNETIQIFESLICCHLSCELYDGDMIIDLHGFSTALARASVRSALNTLRNYYYANKHRTQKNLVIITGIGRNSREKLEPVLKPSIIGWLQNDFEPALTPKEVANNPGRLIVSSQLLSNYFNTQQ